MPFGVATGCSRLAARGSGGPDLDRRMCEGVYESPALCENRRPRQARDPERCAAPRSERTESPVAQKNPRLRACPRAGANQQGSLGSLHRPRHRCQEPLVVDRGRASRPSSAQGRPGGFTARSPARGASLRAVDGDPDSQWFSQRITTHRQYSSRRAPRCPADASDV